MDYKRHILYIGSKTPDLDIILSTVTEKLPELEIIKTDILEPSCVILAKKSKKVRYHYEETKE